MTVGLGTLKVFIFQHITTSVAADGGQDVMKSGSHDVEDNSEFRRKCKDAQELMNNKETAKVSPFITFIRLVCASRMLFHSQKH